MKNKNIIIENKFKFFKKKTVKLDHLSKIYSNILLELKDDLFNDQKTLNVLSKEFKFNFNFSNLKKFKKFNSIAIIGMGGSILGIKSIYNFLKKKIKKKIYFFDDINEYKVTKLKQSKNLSKILFIIISKSGNTIETLSNVFSLNFVKKGAKNIIIISEKKNSLLFELSKNQDLFFIEHKKNIGGRYSVLSEVGIVPAYLMGVNIFKLRSKILNFLKINNKKFLKESSIMLANLLCTKKFNNMIFLNYSPELKESLFWCQQLIAESLGKKGKGFLPVVSNTPKDHHSLLQLYLDGPKDKIFYIFSVETKKKHKVRINKYLKNKNFLNDKYINSIKNAQKNALIKSLIKNKISYREFKIKNLNEETLGMFFAYFIVETIIIGKLSKINPYTQPAVEQVKNNTKILLNQKNQK